MNGPHLDDLSLGSLRLEEIPAGVVVFDRGLVVALNSMAEELLGVSRRRLLGRSLPALRSLIPITSPERLPWVPEPGQSLSIRVEIANPSLGPRTLLVTFAAPIDGPSGAPAGAGGHGRLLALLNDITGQSWLAREGATRERLDELATMARGLAHEIRNPLAGLKGMLQLIERDPAGAGELLDLAQKEIERLERLLEQVRALGGRTTPQKMDAVDLHEVEHDVEQVLRTEFPAVLFEADLDISLPPVAGRRDELYGMVMNLIRNACQAVVAAHPDGGGRVRIKTGRPDRLIRLPLAGSAAARGMVAVQVHDNGPGVPAGDVPHLFEAFFTTRSKGQGLGLALCRRTALAHGGWIDYTPSLTEGDGGTVRGEGLGGACFTVFLPWQK